MLYAFFVVACLCSNYMIAMQNEVSLKNKDNEISSQEKILHNFAKKRGYDKEGYIIMGENAMLLPFSEIQIMVPVGKDGCFMSFPINHPIHEELKKQAIEKNNNNLVMSK